MLVLQSIARRGYDRRRDIQGFADLNDYALQGAVCYVEAEGLVEHEEYGPLWVTEEGKA